MVLQSYLTSTLSNVLKDFVLEFNPDDLNLLLTRGQVELHNTRLNLPSLNSKILATTPLLITSGSIGRLKIGIQWSAITTSPLVVEIDDMRLIVAARPGYCLDTQKIEEALDAAKKAALAALESTLLSSIGTTEAQKIAPIKPPPGTSLILRIIAAIINTFQFKLTGLHITVDHNTISPSVASKNDVIKLAGAEALQQKGDDDGDSGASGLKDKLKPVLNIALAKFDFRTATDGVHKDVQIDKFCVYVEEKKDYAPSGGAGAKPSSTVTPATQSEAATDVFQHAVEGRSNFLMHPFSTTVKLHFDNKSSVGMAVRFVGAMESIRTMVGVAQANMIGAVVGPIGKTGARIAEVQTHYKKQWKRGDEKVREEYFQLYKATLNALWLQAPTEEDAKRLEEIEKATKQETLELWRANAIAELKFELHKTGEAKIMKREQTVGTVSKVIGSIRSLISGKKADLPGQTADSPAHSLTDEQREAIRDEVLTSGAGAAPPVPGPVDERN